MRFNAPATICLWASTVVNAFPAPQENSTLASIFNEAMAILPNVASTEMAVALDQLAKLTKFASDASQNALNTQAEAWSLHPLQVIYS